MGLRSTGICYLDTKEYHHLLISYNNSTVPVYVVANIVDVVILVHHYLTYHILQFLFDDMKFQHFDVS